MTISRILAGTLVTAAWVCASVAHGQSTQPAASQPAYKTFTGTIASVDPAAGILMLKWRHPRQPTELELKVHVVATSEVFLNGAKATAADLKPGDRVEMTGRAEGLDRENKLVAVKLDASRVDPEVDKILDRLEQKKIDDLETGITFTKTDPILQDKQVFKGILRFKQDRPNPRFLIRFDKFIQEGVTRDKQEWHVFDGQWYIEARDSTKTIVKRQIVRPGEEIDVFRIGQGPFPLPFGQKKAEILKYFTVKLVPPTPKDPPETDHLACTPKPGTDMDKKYGEVHFFIHRQLDLPIVVRTVEKGENVEVQAEFPAASIRLNTGMAGGSALNLPELRDYQVDTVPLSDRPNP